MLPLPTKEELTAIYECYVEKGDRLAVERQRAQDVYPNKLKVVKSLVGGNRLLDVGAGLGTFVRVAMDAGFAAVGVEYSKEQCDVARRQYGINLLNDVIENWSIYFHPGSFDVVNMHHVFEHLLYPRSILPCVHEILASGGVLLIEVPNQFNRLRGNHSFYPRFSGYSGNPLHHQSFFSPKNLIRMVSSEGFSLITCRQFRENSEYDRGFVWNFSRKMYRYVVNKFSVGGGSFIECYFLKN
ncbi:MAG: class I SAM-dependent methyltransferase [Thermodesulfobacteriota bacterium]